MKILSLLKYRMVRRRQSGYALATILVLLGVAMFGAGAIVTISGLESKISRSQKEGVSAYYAAEAGIQVGLWHLNNTIADSSALVAGTLDQTYTGTDVPSPGQGFTVHMYTSPSRGAGYGVLDVAGYSDNGTFRANRKITTNVFQGVIGSPTGTNGFFGGGSVSITNGSSIVHINGGDLYGKTSITVNGATVNMNNNYFQTTGAYHLGGGGTVNNLAGVNYLASAIPPPGLDFSYYRANNTAFYTPGDFTDLIDDADVSSPINIPGPVTFVDGSVVLNSSVAKNKTINVTGMLIINGNFTTNASGFTINVVNPGDNKSGVFIQSNLSNNAGRWIVDGVVYTSGRMTFTNAESNNIDGAVIAGGDININVGLPMQLTYRPEKVTANFGTGSGLSVEVQHWEEEY